MRQQHDKTDYKIYNTDIRKLITKSIKCQQRISLATLSIANLFGKFNSIFRYFEYNREHIFHLIDRFNHVVMPCASQHYYVNHTMALSAAPSLCPSG